MPIRVKTAAALIHKIERKLVTLKEGLSAQDRSLLNDSQQSSRFKIAWCDLTSPDYRTNHRWRTARQRYRAVLKKSAQLFLAFILTVSPIQCNEKYILSVIDRISSLPESDRQFKLNTADGSALNSAALNCGFETSEHFRGFSEIICALRPRNERHRSLQHHNTRIETSKLESPSISTIQHVFEARMSTAIDRMPNSAHAMLTMILPQQLSTSEDGLITIEVKADCVEDIAFDLLGIIVFEERGRRAVIFPGGLKTILTNNLSLEGIHPTAIVHVFGEDIYAWTKESPSRKRELEKEQMLTDCIWMELSENPCMGARITMALGSRDGIQIANRLFN